MDGLADDTLPVEDQSPEATEGAPSGTSADQVESFTDIDPDEKPEGEVTPEWLSERYKQMQADYTRKRQADAETAKQRAEELEFLESLRSDPETQRAVYEQLADLIADLDEDDYDENDEFSDDDVDPQQAELARQVEELRQAEEERTARALASSLVEHIESLGKEAGIELDEADLRDIFGQATAGDKVNQDVTKAAFTAWHNREKAKQQKWQERYLASKQAPAQVPPGQSAQDAPDLSNRDERIRRMAAILQSE